MFEKSIIYLLFPTIFSSISVESAFKVNAENKEQMSNQEIIEMGIEKVKSTYNDISFERIHSFLDLSTYEESKTKSLKQDYSPIDSCNSEKTCNL